MLNCVFRHASNSAWPGSTAKTDIKLFVEHDESAKLSFAEKANKSENDANCLYVCLL